MSRSSFHPTVWESTSRKSCGPWHSSLGMTTVPHPGKDRWQDIARFGERVITAEHAIEIATRVRVNLT